MEGGGSCLRVLRGHEGKIWSVDADRKVEPRGREGERETANFSCAVIDFFLPAANRRQSVLGLSVSFAEEAFLRKQSP